MATRLDPQLLDELKSYGAVGVEKCFNCGNCTAICPLTSDQHPFPRNMIRLAQVGAEKRLLASPDPWLCYYCGDCSATCPKGGEPGETMMAMRRWLTAKYDWTGLARLFYTSKIWEVGSILLVGAVIILLFAIFHGPVVTERVELNTFAPIEIVHILDLIMAGGLLFFLLTNLFRMHQYIMGKHPEAKAPLSLYAREAWRLAYHFFTQERFSKCEDRKRWINHMLLVSGYVLMLIMIVLFLPWFQTDNLYPLYHPQRWLGYYATIVLLYGAGEALWGRLRKENQMHRFSHMSDWIFPILLIIGAITGILVHAFRYLGMPLPTYYTYVIHLAFMVPMLVLEVPFGKWSHLAYRPFAIFFQTVQDKALERSTAAEALSPAAAD
jgi:quinone-modifying oxidoreductase, subunit QmoC